MPHCYLFARGSRFMAGIFAFALLFRHCTLHVIRRRGKNSRFPPPPHCVRAATDRDFSPHGYMPGVRVNLR